MGANSEVQPGSGTLTGPVVPKPRSAAEWAGVIRADLGASVQGVIDAGADLAAAREGIPRGDWEEWLARELHMTPRTAQRFMAIARHPVLANTTHVSLLPSSWGTLYELSRLPEAALTRAIEAGDISPETTRQDVAALKPPQPPRTGDTPGNGAQPPVQPDPAVAAVMKDTSTAASTEVNTAPPGGQESHQEPPAPPAPADGRGTPEDTAAEITVVPGDKQEDADRKCRAYEGDGGVPGVDLALAARRGGHLARGHLPGVPGQGAPGPPGPALRPGRAVLRRGGGGGRAAGRAGG